MLNIEIFKDYLLNFSSIIQTVEKLQAFKIRANISLDGRTAAAEMLFILKLN